MLLGLPLPSACVVLLPVLRHKARHSIWILLSHLLHLLIQATHPHGVLLLELSLWLELRLGLGLHGLRLLLPLLLLRHLFHVLLHVRLLLHDLLGLRLLAHRHALLLVHLLVLLLGLLLLLSLLLPIAVVLAHICRLLHALLMLVHHLLLLLGGDLLLRLLLLLLRLGSSRLDRRGR